MGSNDAKTGTEIGVQSDQQERLQVERVRRSDASPSDPSANATAFLSNNANAPDASYSPIDVHNAAVFQHHVRKPSEAGLHIQTHIEPDKSPDVQQARDDSYHTLPAAMEPLRPSFASARSRSFDSTSNPFSSPSSVSSPQLAALADVTPLPSPLVAHYSPDLWKRVTTRSRGNSAASVARDEAAGLLPPSLLSSSPGRKKKAYPNLASGPSTAHSMVMQQETEADHSRNRSISEFVPEALQNVRPRNITTPTVATPDGRGQATPPVEHPLHREKDLSNRRKQTVPEAKPQEARPDMPSPPPSSRSVADSDEGDSIREQLGVAAIQTNSGGRARHWRPIRRLGHGAFSQVVLAQEDDGVGYDSTSEAELVAIKIVSHDPSGGSDEERMGTSIKREVEMLESVNHACLPQMLGYEDNPSRALLVLNYCPGGDLFELASQRRELLQPALVRRIFAELVDAVSYLHGQYIVHRDIKLENAILNIPVKCIQELVDPMSYPYPLVTLTDLGLSRRIPREPESPLLSHPCGSEDYAAPELLLGQAYDGRCTDAWALGVLLYALLEGRLPFDALPGKRNTGNVKHRIARCDWLWCEYGDRYGEWVEEKGRQFEGAREVVEGLLKKVGRGRWPLSKVAGHSWVHNGLALDGELVRPRKAMSG